LSIGPPAALPLLAVMVDMESRKDRGTWSRGSFNDDETTEAPYNLLARLRSPQTIAPLVRMLRDRDLHREGRRGAAIALAWPGNREGLDALVERALDPAEDLELRIDFLLRLPRLELPPPPSLRELLDEPLGEIDLAAAGALALLGDLEGLPL